MGALFFWGLAAAAAEHAVVRHVLDGDSLVLADGRELRLIGVNAPELGGRSRHPDPATAPGVALPPASMPSARDTSASLHVAPEQPLARAARTLLASLIEGRRVRLVYETERQDRYRRLLAHVLFTDADGAERSAEEVLLAQGLAWMVAIPPNVGWVSRLQAAEAEARRAGRGVWREPGLAPRAAEQLDESATGFRLVSGTIRRLGQSRQLLYFDLAPRFTLVVPREDWGRYFASFGRPEQLVGKTLVARGWVTPHERGLRLRVAHPAMLTFRD